MPSHTEISKSRMPSSRMRTVCCSGCLHWEGGCLPRGVSARGRRVSAYGGEVSAQGGLLWKEFLTHACENNTFLQLRLRTVTSHQSEILHSLIFVFFQEVQVILVYFVFAVFSIFVIDRVLWESIIWQYTILARLESGMVNSKYFVDKVLLWIKWKFELTVYFKHGILGKL